MQRAWHVANDRVLDNDSLPLLGLDVDLDSETVYISTCETKKLTVNAAFQVGEDIAVEASVYGEADVDVLVYRADAYGLPDNSPIVIHDYEFNESYAEGQVVLYLEVILETTVNDNRDVSAPAFVSARVAERSQ